TRAVERAAARLSDSAHANAGRAAGAALAGLALPAIDLPRVLEIAEFAVGLNVVAQRRAACGDGLLQGFLDRQNQPRGTGARYSRRRALRATPGTEQCLAGVDIAQAGDPLLIEQSRLDRRAPACQRRRQSCRGEVLCQRLGA